MKSIFYKQILKKTIKGWTVTVAGTYSDDMAPDVQMHLSFPKRSISQGNKSRDHRIIQQTNVKPMELNLNQEDDLLGDEPKNYKPAILPSSIALNPKRSLTKNHFGMGIN